MDRDLDALLSTRPTIDGRDDEFEELWEHVMTTRPKPATLPLGPIALASHKGPPPSAAPMARAATATSRRVPKVGTVIQRSTATNNRKIQALMETPPPPPRRAVNKKINTGQRPIHRTDTEQVLESLFGDTLSDLSDDDRPPDSPASPRAEPTPRTEPGKQETPGNNSGRMKPSPIVIAVSRGIDITVPYYAVHVSRRYKARVGNRRFLLRFNRAGKCRTYREL